MTGNGTIPPIKMGILGDGFWYFMVLFYLHRKIKLFRPWWMFQAMKKHGPFKMGVHDDHDDQQVPKFQTKTTGLMYVNEC
jgi:hypothetical protein